MKLRLRSAHQRGQLLIDDFDDLLGGHQAFEHLRSHGALGDLVYEFADDLEIDVGFQQRELDRAHAFSDVLFGQRAFVPEFLKGFRELFLKVLKHGFLRFRDTFVMV